ncbi:MAG: DUF6434 domain-containing protein [Pseudomonadota bacterium]
MLEPLRPDFSPTLTGVEFDRWYWSKEDLTQFCKQLGLPQSGSRDALRFRVVHALDGKPQPAREKPTTKSRFPWSKADLSESTLITDNVSFGPNVHRWFESQIGPQFVCHGDFMAWVRANVGQTLGEAVRAWHLLEARKDDPEFRRDIADHNTYLQYLRDFKDANPERSMDEAKTCWKARKIRPAPGGKIIYQSGDLSFLSMSLT